MVTPDTLVVIPARMASRRFPGKPLVPIAGEPLLAHVWRAAAAWPRASRVVVSTPDPPIQFWGERAVELFSSSLSKMSCRNGTVRVVETFASIKLQPPPAYVVNLQADEPCITPEMLDKLLPVEPHFCTTLATPFTDPLSSLDPNLVKVVCDSSSRAIYFSRAPLRGALQHIGVYAFAASSLEAELPPPSPLAQAEDLEQLDWLYAGLSVGVRIVESAGPSVNVPEDIPLVEKWLLARERECRNPS